jgi:hypothetical protein
MILPFFKEQLTECDTKNETNYNSELHPVVAAYPTVFSLIFPFILQSIRVTLPKYKKVSP